jgi:hypothetical protein
MPFGFLYSSIIILICEIFLSFFCLWALVRVTRCMAFFPLVHFHILRGFLNIFPSCLFPSLANDTHKIGSTHVVPLAFDHFVSQLVFLGLVVQFHNCSAWAPFGLPFSSPS